MRKVSRLAALVAVVSVTAAIAAPAVAAPNDTVGRFVQEFAKAKNLNATDPRIAADSLAAVGIRVPADLDFSARLTEGDVARISRSAGLNVTTSRPDTPFSSEQVDRFFQSFGRELNETDGVTATRAGNGPKFDPFSKGKGKHKGHGKGHRTPTDPE
jgi:hypothetical protein